MDTVPLVVNRIDDGQRLLDQLAEKGFVVRAACWLKRADRDRWLLYIASPCVDERGTLEAYRQLTPVLQTIGEGWLTSSDVTVVGEKHPLVAYARDILHRFPHRSPISSPRSLGAGLSIEEVYVYALGKVPVTIYAQRFPGAPGDFGHRSLEPFPPDITLSIDNKVYHPQTFIEYTVAAPEGAKLERTGTGEMVLAWEDLHGKRKQSNATDILVRADDARDGFRILRENR
jgi:hypothetical protein